MSLVEWNPFRDFEAMGRDMGNYLERSPFKFWNGSNTPRVDVYQTDKEIIVKAEIPGVSKEDLNVFVEDSMIRLSGEYRKNDEYKDENVYRTERYFGNFSRSIPLPVEIKADDARAEYRDGILSIIASKTEPSRTKGRKIDIQ